MNKEEFIENHKMELKELLIQLCSIPAPLHQEGERASFIKDWLLAQGADTTVLDETGNVLFPYQVHNHSKIIVMMAHMDTVFSKDTSLMVSQEENRMYCPGIGDDTANLAVMLMLAKYTVMHQPDLPYGILFVADCGEEGLGNLYGCRSVVHRYQKQIAYMIAFDLHYHSIISRPVGSIRYEVQVKTQGGHSYHDFGKPNAIAVLSEIIYHLYQYSSQDGKSKTTYNAGLIHGGTAVNCIAALATMTVDLRSDSYEELKKLDDYFGQILKKAQERNVWIEKCEIGNRPCMRLDEDIMKKQRLLEKRFQKLLSQQLRENVFLTSGSTDCNIPLSLGIPAISFGLCDGGGVHTIEEWIKAESLTTGLAIAIDCMGVFSENFL